MRRIWYVVAFVLLAAGLYGLLPALSATRVSDPKALELRFPGSATAAGTVGVQRAGEHAIWASGSPDPDAGRCRITAPSGPAVPVTAPSKRVDWVVAGEDDAVYTWIATFEAAQPGLYGIQCSSDPKAPGASYYVTERPDVASTTGRTVAGTAGVLLAVALAVVTFVRRRRRPATKIDMKVR